MMNLRNLLIGSVLVTALCIFATGVSAQDAPAPPGDGQLTNNPGQGAGEQDSSGDQGSGGQPTGGKDSTDKPGDNGQTGSKSNSERTPTFLDNPMFLVVMVGGLFLMFFLSSRSKKKQQNKRKEMLAAIKKGDKVTSIGGIIGTVVSLKEDEVVVRVDESTSARMRFARWAIRGVGDEGKDESPEKK